MHRKLEAWLDRPRRKLVALGAGAMVLAVSATAGTAAIRELLFSDVPPVPDAALDTMRGGFTLPQFPDLQMTFGFRFENLAELPDGVGQLVPSIVATVVADRSVAQSSTGATLRSGPGTQLGSVTTIKFKDPSSAKVRITETLNGAVISQEKKIVDLTQETVTLKVGRPDAALITQHLDAHQVSTIMQSVLGDTNLRSSIAASITVDGWSQFRSKLPSAGVVHSIRAVEDAVRLTVSR